MPKRLLQFYHAVKIRITMLLNVRFKGKQLLKPTFAFCTPASAAKPQCTK